MASRGGQVRTNLPTFSRFAVLEAEDTSSSDEEAGRKKQKDASDGSKISKSAKKRARKKKKAATDSVSNDDLRQMAFGKTVSTRAIQSVLINHPIGTESQQDDCLQLKEEKPPKEHQDDDVSWDNWIKKDEQFVVDQFQRDLQEALRISTVESKNLKKNMTSGDTHSRTEKKASQKKEHAAKMSLEEFQANQHDRAREHSLEKNTKNGHVVEMDSFYTQETEHDRNETSVNKKSKKKKRKSKSQNTNELNPVEKHVLPCENHDDNVNYRDLPSVTTNGTTEDFPLDPTSVAQWQNEIEIRDKAIEKLKKVVKELKEELSQVKKRNKQLCFILGQGEMRDKSELVQQIEQLTTVKDELSLELSEMHSSLEQEKTKSSSLKLELLKYQGGRSKKQSVSESDH